MSYQLYPASSVPAKILPSTGSVSDVAASVPLGVYSNEPSFLSGAAAQVAYVFTSLGGDILDIELTPKIVYSNYETAVLEYSSILLMHQIENTLSNMLGNDTGSFDHMGQLSGSNVPTDLALRYPRFSFGYARRVSDAAAAEAGFGPDHAEFSASIDIVEGVQDYDLQSLIAAMPEFSGSIGARRIVINRVFFRSHLSNWRFYGFMGGLNTVGNLSTYGQYRDDAVFEIVPVWQNKLQAMAYEDALWTRTSHFSYELKGNKIRIFPVPSGMSASKLWIQFSIPINVWEETEDYSIGIHGVNNANSVPFQNIPYTKIGAWGKQWIRKYCLALCKMSLSHIRGKLDRIPIAGNEVTLNHAALADQGQREAEELRKELIEYFGKNGYNDLIESDAALMKVAVEVQKEVPLLIYRL